MFDVSDKRGKNFRYFKDESNSLGKWILFIKSINNDITMANAPKKFVLMFEVVELLNWLQCNNCNCIMSRDQKIVTRITSVALTQPSALFLSFLHRRYCTN